MGRIAVMSVVGLAIGWLISSAWAARDQQEQRLDRLPPDLRAGLAGGDLDLADAYAALRADSDKLKEDLKKIREENTRLQNTMAQGQSASKELNKSLQELKVFAALTEVEGPGILVTLRDAKVGDEQPIETSDAIIHDMDVLRVVNELWNAGAEAVSVNSLRVGPGTSFRCVGATILVDNERIASPVRIRAIGDPETLSGGLNLPGGILDNLRQVQESMVSLEPVKSMRMPAYSGPTSRRKAVAPAEKESEAGDS
jgi:uncharacterized protein YlxW (UPF0749 family)